MKFIRVGLEQLPQFVSTNFVWVKRTGCPERQEEKNGRRRRGNRSLRMIKNLTPKWTNFPDRENFWLSVRQKNDQNHIRLLKVWLFFTWSCFNQSINQAFQDQKLSQTLANKFVVLRKSLRKLKVCGSLYRVFKKCLCGEFYFIFLLFYYLSFVSQWYLFHSKILTAERLFEQLVSLIHLRFIQWSMLRFSQQILRWSNVKL